MGGQEKGEPAIPAVTLASINVWQPPSAELSGSSFSVCCSDGGGSFTAALCRPLGITLRTPGWEPLLCTKMAASPHPLAYLGLPVTACVQLHDLPCSGCSAYQGHLSPISWLERLRSLGALWLVAGILEKNQQGRAKASVSTDSQS